MDVIPDNLTLQTPDLKIVWANKAAADSLGKRVEDLIGEYCYRLWHGIFEPCKVCPVQKSFKTGKAEIEEVKTPDGRIWELRAFPLFDEANNINGVIEIGRDITEHKRDLEELQRHRRHLEEMVEKRTEELRKIVSVLAGREERMAELKKVIRTLHKQIVAAGLIPVADDPLSKYSEGEYEE